MSHILQIWSRNSKLIDESSVVLSKQPNFEFQGRQVVSIAKRLDGRELETWKFVLNNMPEGFLPVLWHEYNEETWFLHNAEINYWSIKDSIIRWELIFSHPKKG